METAKVYFTDFRTQAFGDGLPTKLKKLVRRAGIADLDLEGKFVAIKLHFGELGNVSYLRPNYATRPRGRGEGARRQAVPHRLQHHVPRQPQERPRAPGMRMGERLHAAHGGLPHPHRRRPEGHRRRGGAGGRRRVREGGEDRPRRHGRRRVREPHALQGPRAHRVRRRHQEHRHGLRLARRQDRAAQQRPARHRRGEVPRLQEVPARMRRTAASCSTRPPGRWAWTRNVA